MSHKPQGILTLTGCESSMVLDSRETTVDNPATQGSLLHKVRAHHGFYCIEEKTKA